MSDPRTQADATSGPDGDQDPYVVAEDDADRDLNEAEVVDEVAGGIPSLEIPDDPDEAVAFLMAELLAARAAAAEAVDRWKRSVAEFDNFRKRSQRDQATMVARSSERVLVRLLPVLDGLDAATAVEAGAASEESLRKGLTGTRDLLLSILAKEGMEPIEALGRVFDPNLHEAAQLAEGSGTMVVNAEWRRGYTLNGRVIRATLVAVGYEPDRTESPEESNEEQASVG